MIDEAELAIRILEASMERLRPEGMTGREALAELDEDSQRRCMAGARAALEYLKDQIKDRLNMARTVN